MFSLWIARLGSVLTLAGALILLLRSLYSYGVFIPSFFGFYQSTGFLTGKEPFGFALLVEYLCFAAGLVGLVLVQTDWLGRLAGGLAVLGALLAAATYALFIWPFALRVNFAFGYDSLSFLTDMLMALGLVVCGVFTFTTKALPRWNVAPLLLGLWLTLSLVRGLFFGSKYLVIVVYNPATSPSPPNNLWVFILSSALSLVLWVLLGVALWPRKHVAMPQSSQPAVEALS